MRSATPKSKEDATRQTLRMPPDHSHRYYPGQQRMARSRADGAKLRKLVRAARRLALRSRRVGPPSRTFSARRSWGPIAIVACDRVHYRDSHGAAIIGD